MLKVLLSDVRLVDQEIESSEFTLKRHDDERTEEKPFVSRQQRPSWLKVGKPRSLVNWKSGFSLGTQSPSIILQVLNTKEIFLRAFLSKNDKIVFATKVSCLPFLSSRYTQRGVYNKESARLDNCTELFSPFGRRMVSYLATKIKRENLNG